MSWFSSTHPAQVDSADVGFMKCSVRSLGLNVGFDLAIERK